MAEIRPFKGVRYNPQKVQTLSKVVCPPYDIISLELQNRLYQASKYNFIRIEYNRESPQDDNQNNRYTRAAAYLTQWLKQGVLMEDKAPALYIHEHQFICQGKSYRRQNIIAAVKLVEWDSNIIRPHENIIPKAKTDRIRMLQTCQANTSPVLAMYEDPHKIIQSSLSAQILEIPLINFVDPWGDVHKVWAMDQSEIIKPLQQEFEKQPLYIADGHHRYDSALTYKREKTAQSAFISGEEGFNFVMISLVDFSDAGLVILPTHRLIKGIPQPNMGEFKSRLSTFFDIQDFSLDMPDIWPKVNSLLTGMKPDIQEVRMAVIGLESGLLSILTLRDFKAAAQLISGSHSDLFKKLDVSLVDYVILERLLAFDKDKVEGNLAYTHDWQEAVDLVTKGQYQMAFIMNPIKPELIKSIADSGDRMPRKSTYFFPKSPAGLVFYKW